MQIESQPKTWLVKPTSKYQAISQLFKLNKLQLSSLFASVTVLTAGYFALPIPDTTLTVAKPSPPMSIPVNPKVQLLTTPLPIHTPSLEMILQSKLLRVATINDGTTYNLDSDDASGTDFAHGYGYEVVRRYAHKLKVDVKVIAYANEQAALAAVMAGKADMALTNTVTTFTPKKTAIATKTAIADFQKASYQLTQSAVSASSNTQSTVQSDNQLVPNNESQALTSVSLSCHKNFLQQYGLNSRVNWTMPSSANTLASSAKAFLCDSKQIELNKKTAQFYRQTTLNDAFSREHFITTMKTSLPTYQNAFEQNARTYNHDWRLLVAMGYQESQLKPDAVSPTGVRGLMMLTNDTAEAMGIANRSDPSQSIAGGAKYLALLNKEFSAIPNPDRLWFALAAYNMGPAAVNAIQNTINAAGRNGNSWSEVYQFLNQHATENPRYYQCLTYVSHIRSYLDALKLDTQVPKKTLSEV